MRAKAIIGGVFRVVRTSAFIPPNNTDRKNWLVPSLRSIYATIRRLGIVDGSLWATARVASIATFGRLFVQRYYFVAQPVPATADATRASTGVALRPIARDDPLVAQFPRPREVIAARYDMGAVCLAAERQGRFVGFVWLKEIEYPEDEVRCRYRLEPANLAAWDFDVYVDPAYRYGRTFARLWEFAHAWLRERGYRWSLSRISAFNPESIAAHQRLGTRRIGSAIFVRAGNAQLAILDCAPFVHVGWRHEQAPILRLRAPDR